MSSDGIGGPPGLADQVDELLLKLESIRDRPRASALLIGAVVAIAVGGWWLTRPAPAPPVEDYIPLAGSGPADPAGRSPAATDPAGESLVATHDAGVADSGDDATAGDDPVELVVHVVGAIRSPGLVRLPAQSRVSDAVDAAGGALPAADVNRLNLAAPVVDGMQIRVPLVDEPETDPLIVTPEGPAATPSGPIDVNAASAERLQDLPGVGPATAAAIIAWRDDNGPFVVVDDLLAVPGIGPAKLAAIRDLVTT